MAVIKSHCGNVDQVIVNEERPTVNGRVFDRVPRFFLMGPERATG